MLDKLPLTLLGDQLQSACYYSNTNMETEVAFASKLISYSVTCNLNT